MDEITLNPKILQISGLILPYSSQVIAVGEETMCLHSFSVHVFLHKDQEVTIQVIFALWIFCSLASKEKRSQASLLLYFEEESFVNLSCFFFLFNVPLIPSLPSLPCTVL